jgi:hypothetical protein
MSTRVSSEAVPEEKVLLSLQSRGVVETVADGKLATRERPEKIPVGTGDGSLLDEWAVGSACYMCHTCTNFGVQGEEGRPCAKGLSDLIKRRSRARLTMQVTRRETK